MAKIHCLQPFCNYQNQKENYFTEFLYGSVLLLWQILLSSLLTIESAKRETLTL